MKMAMEELKSRFGKVEDVESSSRAEPCKASEEEEKFHLNLDR